MSLNHNPIITIHDYFSKLLKLLIRKDKNASGLSGGFDLDAMEKLYNAYGLKVERIPYYRDDLELKTFSRFTPEQIAKLKALIRQVHIWKITSDPNVSIDVSKQNSYEEGGFSSHFVMPRASCRSSSAEELIPLQRLHF